MDFIKGDRVQVHPAWMVDDRYGTVVHVDGAGFVRIHMDRSDRVVWFDPDNIRHTRQ